MATEKVSLLLPADLLAEVRERAGAGNLSAYVADGLRQRILLDRMGTYLATLDEEFGPVPPEKLEWARRIWRDEI